MKQNNETFYKIILCVAETIVYNWVVYYLFYKIQPNQEIYLYLNPHPLLFLAMFMGLRYGIKLSTLSSSISCIFFIYIFYLLKSDINLFFNFFKYYKYPLLFLWTSFIFGAFRDNHKRKLQLANDQIFDLTKKNKELEKDYKVIDKIQTELKKQIIGSDESIISLYDIATKLETFETEDIFTETIGVLKKYLRATNISLYAFDKVNNYLRLKISYGDYDSDVNSIYAPDCHWFKEVDKERKVVKIGYHPEDTIQPIMVGPLIRNGEIIAVVNIKKMEFDMISEYAFNLFQLIIDWINRALDKATYVENLLEDKYMGDTQLVSSQYFKKRLEIEKRRLTEFGMEYCFISYRIVDLSINQIDDLVKNTLRHVDIAYYNDSKNTLSFLLPATKKSNSFIFEQKIKDKFDQQLVKIELKNAEE